MSANPTKREPNETSNVPGGAGGDDRETVDMVLMLDTNVATLATMMGVAIAWIALMATFTDIAYSMFSRLDNALFTAATAEPGMTVENLESKAVRAKWLIAGYVVSGTILMPISLIVFLLRRRWRK